MVQSWRGVIRNPIQKSCDAACDVVCANLSHDHHQPDS